LLILARCIAQLCYQAGLQFAAFHEAKADKVRMLPLQLPSLLRNLDVKSLMGSTSLVPVRACIASVWQNMLQNCRG
jgi:hypothetical protein